MALVFIEGFDTYAGVSGQGAGIDAQLQSSLFAFSNSVQTSLDTRTGYGRSCLIGSNSSYQGWKRAFPARNEVYFGFAWKFNQPAGAITLQQVMALQYDNLVGLVVSQFIIAVNDVAGISVISPHGELYAASDPNILFGSAWNYIEVHAVAGSAGGTGFIEVRLNGLTVISQACQTITAANSNVTPASQYNILYCCPDNNQTWIDDVYLLNTDGTGQFRDFQGDCVVHGIEVNADVGPNQMTQFGGSVGHYSSQNSIPTDDDTSYLYTATAEQSERFSLSVLPNDILEVLAVGVYVRQKKDSAGLAHFTIDASIAGSGVVANSVLQPVGTTYLTQNIILETKPGGGAWTKTDAQALQVGFTSKA